MTRIFYIRRDKSAALELDGCDHDKAVYRVDPDPPYEFIELLGRVFTLDVDVPRSARRWHYQPTGGEIVRLDAADARSAAWALERAVMTARVAAQLRKVA